MIAYNYSVDCEACGQPDDHPGEENPQAVQRIEVQIDGVWHREWLHAGCVERYIEQQSPTTEEED